MNHISSREIYSPKLVQPSTRKKPVGERAVNEQRPSRNEDHPRLEVDPLNDGTGKQPGRYGGKYELEENYRRGRNVVEGLRRAYCGLGPQGSGIQSRGWDFEEPIVNYLHSRGAEPEIVAQDQTNSDDRGEGFENQEQSV